MSRQFRHPKHTFLKNNIYYFSRSIPVDLRCFYLKPRIIKSLKTKSYSKAKTASKILSSRLDDYWLGLRLKKFEVPATELLVNETNNSLLPTINDSMEIYFAVKGVGRPKQFFSTAWKVPKG